MGCKGSKVRILSHRPTKRPRASGFILRTPFFFGELGESCPEAFSGRFAMLDDGKAFNLVPWPPIADEYLGPQVSVVLRGSSAAWSFGKSRTVGI
ncbi:DUF3363 domain-containing protein [Variovorax fucosicus]|uniref:DUF3363 domain-containing protein n=1 Tax=Variovorax fucosicus TaxID=3053517 RepID=UPI0033659C51